MRIQRQQEIVGIDRQMANGAPSMNNGSATVSPSATSLSEREHQSLVIKYNNFAASYPSNQTVVELFEAQVT